jgi:hypothetical protein
MVENGTERYEHGWKQNGLRHDTGTGTVLFRVRVLTMSCPAFRKFGTARHDTVKAIDTVRNDTGTRHGTEQNDGQMTLLCIVFNLSFVKILTRLQHRPREQQRCKCLQTLGLTMTT